MDAFLHNFRRSFALSTPFFHSLSLNPPAIMKELYRRTYRYSTLEDNIRAAIQTVMITSKPVGSSKLEGKKPSEPKEGQRKNRKRSRDQSQKKREPEQFTPLNITYERMLPLIRNLPDFKWPALIQMDPSQRNPSAGCDYHRDHGHETNRCRSLKFMMERLIKAGHLKKYVREVDGGVEFVPIVDRITVDAAAPSKSRSSINYILGGLFDNQYQLKSQQKKLMRASTVKAQVNIVHIKGSREETKPIDGPISFPPVNPNRVIMSHYDALVDPGSTSNLF